MTGENGNEIPLADALFEAVEQGASDLHVVDGQSPVIRRHGRLIAQATPAYSESRLAEELKQLCNPTDWDSFEQHRNLDFALTLPKASGLQRFRANYFFCGDRCGACFRIIPSEIPDFQWAGFPFDLADELAHLRNGLVLISGVTGAGKTTTLAMIMNLLVNEGGYRILTVEQPIEYLFPSSGDSIVTQREVGKDVASFADGLKYGLRQDPDVILVGEIRDRETAQMALSAAETGHLVFATLHTRDAKGAITRFTDLFPQNTQSEVRGQLALSLRAVVSQHLLASAKPESKRELALEVMFANSAVASAIRFGKIESLESNIQMGRSIGMVTLDESIRSLWQEKRISRTTAERFVSEPGILR